MVVALPITLQGFLLSFVQLVDNLFIGYLESATHIAAGMNAVNNISFIIITIVSQFIMGIGVYFAQASGEGNFTIQKKLFVAKVFWTFFWSSLLLVISTIFLKNLAQLWLPTNEQEGKALFAAQDYGKLIFPSLFLSFFIMMLVSSFREKKIVWPTVCIAIVSIVINASLNYPFMYTFGWGVQGSALATLIARCVELLIWISYILWKKFTFLPEWKDYRTIKFSDLFQIFPKSFWWMMNGLVLSFAFTLQMLFMSRLSIDAGGALHSAGVLAQLVFALTGGYAAALNVILMYKLTQKKSFNLKAYVSLLQKITIIFGILVGGFLASLSWIVYYIYPNYNPNTNKQSMIMLIAIGSTLWMGLWSVIYVTILKGVGYSKMIILLDGVYSWIIVLPTTILLVVFAKSKISFGYIYWIASASNILKPIFLIFFFHKKQSSFKNIIEDLKSHKKKIRNVNKV